MEIRQYQHDISTNAANAMIGKPFAYLAMQVRTGKTITALLTAEKYGAKKVLFITKIKAFSSVKSDYCNFKFGFKMYVINSQSIHKIIPSEYDFIICDEAHGLFGTFPKPNNFTKFYKEHFYYTPVLLLSGTMSPESYSQLFHQFWISKHAPFAQYSNFYKWANDYVDVQNKNLGYSVVRDYSNAKINKFMHLLEPFIHRYTQEQAGFKSVVTEVVLEVDMKTITNQIIEALKKRKVVRSQDGFVILADTGAKMQTKHLQLASGTIKFECGATRTVDDSKAIFIRDYFKDKKIAIFYKFKEELVMLNNVFGDRLTTEIYEFNETDKNIALQFVSGREGINLSKADFIVAINIDFSATTYFQFKDRMTTMDRKENTVYWIFSKGGIERNVYKAVIAKKSYTLDLYKQDYARIKNTI